MDRRYRDLPLNPLRAFAIASQHKTFTSAARHMGVSQVAISRQISTLEDYLGVKLFVRGARSVKLTDVGRSLGLEISVLFEQLEQATHGVLTEESENTIKLRIYPTFAQHWLLPRLREFQTLYPEYRFRLDTTVEPLDFRGTHLDVAIQLGHGTWRDAKCRKLFDETVDVVCSPGYAQDRNWFADPENLASAECCTQSTVARNGKSGRQKRVWRLTIRVGRSLTARCLSIARRGMVLALRWARWIYCRANWRQSS